jgi:hypothetical protein
MMTMLVRSGGFSFEGETMSATQHKPDGAEVKQFACPRCWTHLWAEISTLPAFVTLRAGTLDDSEALIPAMHIWTLSKQAWVVIPDDVPTYLRSPAQRSDYARHLMPK